MEDRQKGLRRSIAEGDRGGEPSDRRGDESKPSDTIRYDFADPDTTVRQRKYGQPEPADAEIGGIGFQAPKSHANSGTF